MVDEPVSQFVNVQRRCAVIGILLASMGAALCAQTAESGPPSPVAGVTAVYDVTVRRLWFDGPDGEIGTRELRGRLEIEMNRERGPDKVTALVRSSILSTRTGKEPPADQDQESASFTCTIGPDGITDLVPVSAADGKNVARTHSPVVRALLAIFPPLRRPGGRATSGEQEPMVNRPGP